MKRGSYVRIGGRLHVVKEFMAEGQAEINRPVQPFANVQPVGNRSGGGHWGWLACSQMTPVSLEEAWSEINARRDTGEWP